MVNLFSLDRWITPLLNLGSLILNALPAKVMYALADMGGTITYWGWPAKRRAALANYRVALGEVVTGAFLDRTTRGSFRTYARMILDVLRMRTMSFERLRQLITLEGLEHLEAGIARGKGIIAVLPHAGNWEPASNIIAFLPYRFLAVVDEGVVSRAVAGSRQRAGMSVVEQSKAARPTIRALRQNSVVILVADLVKDFRAARVQLFGRETYLPAGPAYLAVRTGATVIPVIAIRQADNTSVITVEPPLYPDPRANPVDEAHRISQAIADYFQQVIRGHPEQWYPYRRLWTES
ncbi:MAG: lysophospholipid acyltransferase family protein [Chloroflexota bacterium]